MSDTAEGPGWWMASDNLWYPPELHPEWRGSVPPPQPDYRVPGTDEPAEETGDPDALPSFAAVVPPATRTPAPSGEPETLTVTAPDGRRLAVVVAGPTWGTPVLFHHGTPFAAAPWPGAAEAATSLGLRFVTWSRPGYGGSDPAPGRGVTDTAGDAQAVLEGLGHGACLVLGWSAGGPHALATAAGLGERCRAVATVGSPAPRRAGGLRWETGVPGALADLMDAGELGGDAVRQLLADSGATGGESGGMPPTVAQVLGAALAPVDLAALAAGAREPLAGALAVALAAGPEGWVQDVVALAGDWRDVPATVASPAMVWHGSLDRVVPPAHGEWLVEQVPGARLRAMAEEGHVSLLTSHLDRILAELVDRAGNVPQVS